MVNSRAGGVGSEFFTRVARGQPFGFTAVFYFQPLDFCALEEVKKSACSVGTWDGGCRALYVKRFPRATVGEVLSTVNNAFIAIGAFQGVEEAFGVSGINQDVLGIPRDEHGGSELSFAHKSVGGGI